MIEIEPRQIFYNRTGNLSQTTVLNQELADKFMKFSDLRYDVQIVDSDKRPEHAAVSVGSDVVAWKSIAPLSELSKIVLRPKRYRQTELLNEPLSRVYRMQIHDRIIDDELRREGTRSKEDYEQKYLSKLNKEIKGGLAEVLTWEKLGLKSQYINYAPYLSLLVQIPVALASMSPESLLYVAAYKILLIHPLWSLLSNISARNHQRFDRVMRSYFPGFRPFLPPEINPKHGMEIFLPPVPIDKWIKGERFLASHGDNLITSR